MNKQNSPESVVTQKFANAKREWHDMSHTLLASYASGFITPALCQPITGNTTVFLDMQHAVQTNPTVTPVFDSMRVNVRSFFYPQRLCMRGMYGNNYMEMDEIESMPFPLTPYITPAARSALLTSSGCHVILPGSLLNRLGFPASILGYSWAPIVRNKTPFNDYGYYNKTVSTALNLDAGASTVTTFNLSPIVGYYDICSRYLSNPYDQDIPAIEHEISFTGTTDTVDVEDLVNRDSGVNFYSLYEVRDWLLNVKGIVTSPSQTTMASQRALFSLSGTNSASCAVLGLNGPIGPLTQFVQSSVSSPTYGAVADAVNGKSYQLGLWPSLYMEDISSAYFDTEEIEGLMAVDLGSDVESYRLGKSIWNRMFRAILRGKKLDDWIEIQFGSRLKTADHPIFVGADHFNINFNDVLNQSASSQSDSSGINIPLGAAAGRGSKGSENKRRISFTAPEPGFLFVLIDLVPYVSYPNAIPSWLDWETYADYPLPAYAGRNFRDLRLGEVAFIGSEELENTVIGKQPLYYDFMATRDRLGGIFETDLLDTYTMKRQYNTSAYIPGENTLVEQIGSTYVQKGMYDYSFPDWGQNGGENYFIKTQFNLRLLQPIPNDVLKTRI